MELLRFADVAGFMGAAEAFLAAREAEHNLMLGLCAQLRAGRHSYATPFYLAVVARAGAPLAAALRTPPHDLILSRVDDLAALPLLVDDLSATYPQGLSGVLGPREEAGALAAQWAARHRLVPRRAMAERVHSLESVTPPRGVPGAPRPAVEGDRALLVAWTLAFHVDALQPIEEERAADLVASGLPEGPVRGIRVWEDEGRPVSMAIWTGPTPTGVRIGGVYTPPERRGRGYASACVAALSQELLDRGRRRVFLFTDLKNPVSNRIYARIGYRPAGDVDRWRFERA